MIFNSMNQMLQHHATAALEGANFNRSFILSLTCVQLHMQRVQQLQQVKQHTIGALLQPGPGNTTAAGSSTGSATRSGGNLDSAGSKAAAWADRVEQGQLQLLAATEKLGQEAVAAHAAWAATAEGVPNSAVDQIKELLEQLPAMKGRVSRAGTAREVMEVLAAAMDGSRGWLRGNEAALDTSMMRGHVYQCPNGHMYVIGNCGGAMQRARCMECGAPIGGQSHELEAANRPADGVLAEMAAVLRARQ